MVDCTTVTLMLALIFLVAVAVSLPVVVSLSVLPKSLEPWLGFTLPSPLHRGDRVLGPRPHTPKALHFKYKPYYGFG